MNSRRDFRNNRVALFDGVEEGGVRSSMYSSREIHKHENDQAIDSMQDRVSILKRAKRQTAGSPEHCECQMVIWILRKFHSAFVGVVHYSANVLHVVQLTGDIHEEVDSHNRMLDRMRNDMDASRGILSGTVDKFRLVFETKSSRRMATMVASFIAVFLLIYYLTK